MKQIKINNIDDLLEFVEQADNIELLEKVIKSTLNSSIVTIGEFTLQEFKDGLKDHILTYWKDREQLEKPMFILLPSDFLPNIKKTYLNTK